jgi:hypothetical protein
MDTSDEMYAMPAGFTEEDEAIGRVDVDCRSAPIMVGTRIVVLGSLVM